MGDTSRLLLQTRSVAHVLSQHKSCSFGTVRWGMFFLPCLRTRRWMDPRKESLNSLRFWLSQKHNEIKAVNLDFGKVFNFLVALTLNEPCVVDNSWFPFTPAVETIVVLTYLTDVSTTLIFWGTLILAATKIIWSLLPKEIMGVQHTTNLLDHLPLPAFERKQNSLENRL